MGDLLGSRRAETDARLDTLRGKLGGCVERLAGKACVYLTGSFGRGEASAHSDLDLFIAGRVDDSEKPLLSRLDQICVKADLIEAARELEFQEFTGDGQYLELYTVGQLVKTLGKPNDDASNTFTARLLLLLESRPLLERNVYDGAVDAVIEPYWRDYEDHKNEFVPAFLANGILRLWRTFCVNYEARTMREPDDKRAKRKLKNYKLKHSRLLTCYSALAFLSAEFALHGTVAPDSVQRMVGLTPTARLEHLASLPQLTSVHRHVSAILERYEAFLLQTDAPEDVLIARFMDTEQRKTFKGDNELGDRVAELLLGIGELAGNKTFHRLLLV
jgi:hypothetical protein